MTGLQVSHTSGPQPAVVRCPYSQSGPGRSGRRGTRVVNLLLQHPAHLSIRHLFLLPVHTAREINHCVGGGVGWACRPRKQDEGPFFTSHRCLEQECAVTLGNRSRCISRR